MDIARHLERHPLFATFTLQTLAEAVRAGTLVSYEPGDLCVRHEEAGEIFGVLLSGRLEAVRNYASPERQNLGYIEAGECFGEMSLLTGTSGGTAVVALTPAQAVVFLQEAISPLLAQNRESVQFLTRLITRRLSKPQEGPKAPRAKAQRLALGAFTPLRVLALSCRRNDLRYSYFDTTSERALARGEVSGLGAAGDEGVHTHTSAQGAWQQAVKGLDHEAAVLAAVRALTAPVGGVLGSIAELSVVGHRVVHGGVRYNGPALVDAEVKQEIRRLADLAPLDNEYNLRGIEAGEKLLPTVPQVAVFDTAFHLTIPPAAHRYALPREYADDLDLRRYGFHGISHEGASRAAAAALGAPFESLRIISCHLGLGASLSAIDHGRAVDNTMGFTPLEGLVMSTRCGDVDPGLLLYLLRRDQTPVAEMTRRLFTASGLLGLSGISGDVLEIMAAAECGDPRAMLALQVFCQRARKYLAAFVGVLGGVDVVVFTGGVGENAAGARARICQGLDCMGIALDEARNRTAQVKPGEAVEVSLPQSRAHVFVVGSDEEHTIACKTVQALSHKRVTDVIREKPRPIPIGVSAHHLHLTQPHVEALFGPGHTLTWHADLTQPGQYACKEQVNLIGPKGRIERVRVLGPVRPESQVEIARTEEFKLGIDAPIRLSGDLGGTPGIVLEGPTGQVKLDHGVICAMRHIHMSPTDAMEFALRDHDVVRIRTSGERSLVFGDVVVRVHPDFRLDMHIDTDEANAAEVGVGAVGYVDSIQARASG
jgi:acetate kinase